MVRWGIAGAGGIAKQFAGELQHTSSGELTAVGSRDLSRAESWLDSIQLGDHSVRAHGSYEELFADANVDAVYIAVTHPQHAALVVQAATAGKHILCEKPAGVTLADATAEIEAARAADVYFCEAFMHRFHPQFVRMRELIAEGAIGEVQHVDAAFASRSSSTAEQRWLNPATAGGGILDLGCYTVSAALGAATTAGATEWRLTRAAGTLGETGVDLWAVAGLEFETGVTAQLSTGMGLGIASQITVYGSAGWLRLDDPWLPKPGAPVTIQLSRVSTGPETIGIPGVYQYALEADALARNAGERNEAPELTWNDTLAIAGILEQWRHRIGLRFPFE